MSLDGYHPRLFRQGSKWKNTLVLGRASANRFISVLNGKTLF